MDVHFLFAFTCCAMYSYANKFYVHLIVKEKMSSAAGKKREQNKKPDIVIIEVSMMVIFQASQHCNDR